jgi:hypothetical protein
MVFVVVLLSMLILFIPQFKCCRCPCFFCVVVAVVADIAILLLPSLLWLMHMLDNAISVAVVVLPLLICS